MKILLLWDGKGPEITNLMLKLKGQSNKIVYWIGAPGGEKDKLPETIFHSSMDALHGMPAKNIDISKLPQPGKDLIDKLYKVESLILTMMNAKHNDFCSDERKHLYYNMVQYWYGILEKYRPDVIVCGNIPHAAHSYLIFELALLLNIRTIMSEDTTVYDRMITYSDFKKGSDELHEEIKKNQGKNFSLKDLNKDLQKYYKTQTDSSHDATPVYINVLTNRYTGFSLFLRKLKNLKKSIKQGTVFKKILQSVFKIFKQDLKKEYRSIQVKPDFNKKFIYAPLHLQPERTTSPQGDIFVDQILMIEILSASLPPNWIIYVKEHPVQWLHRGFNFSCARYQGYYKKIAKIKNVKLIPIETDTYVLIKKSQIVATVTGIAAWESVLRLKPAIIFGYAWFRDCHGIFKVNDVESCKKTIKEITNGFAISKQQIINYLKCLDDATIHAYFDPDLKDNSKLTEKENMNNIIQKIIFEIEKK